MIVGKIENGLERGFVKHRLNHLSITDSLSLLRPSLSKLMFLRRYGGGGQNPSPGHTRQLRPVESYLFTISGSGENEIRVFLTGSKRWPPFRYSLYSTAERGLENSVSVCLYEYYSQRSIGTTSVSLSENTLSLQQQRTGYREVSHTVELT